MIVGMANFSEWLNGIGISACIESILGVARKRGIPLNKAATQRSASYVFDTDSIKEYVLGLVGVPLDCWLAERSVERKKSKRRVFAVRGALVERSSSTRDNPLFLATVSRVYSGHTSGVRYDAPIIVNGKLWATRESRAAERWDYGAASSTWKIWSYGSMYVYDPKVAEGKSIPYVDLDGGLACTALAFETLDGSGKPCPVKVPAQMLGEPKERAEVSAIIPATHPMRRRLAKHVRKSHPFVKMIVWTHGVRRTPITLDPVTFTSKDRRNARAMGLPAKAQLISIEDEHA